MNNRKVEKILILSIERMILTFRKSHKANCTFTGMVF